MTSLKNNTFKGINQELYTSTGKSSLNKTGVSKAKSLSPAYMLLYFLFGVSFGIACMYYKQTQHKGADIASLKKAEYVRTVSSSQEKPKMEYPSKQEKPIFDDSSPLV